VHFIRTTIRFYSSTLAREGSMRFLSIVLLCVIWSMLAFGQEKVEVLDMHRLVDEALQNNP